MAYLKQSWSIKILHWLQIKTGKSGLKVAVSGGTEPEFTVFTGSQCMIVFLASYEFMLVVIEKFKSFMLFFIVAYKLIEFTTSFITA